LFNRKARLWVAGRKNIFKDIGAAVNSNIEYRPSSMVWFHCASLGEFEQAGPLIDKVKAKGERLRVLVTFFSPSGYEIRKNYEGADFVFYLPVDTKGSVGKFLDIVKPSLVFFVKYDFWYNYLCELNKRKIPTYLVSANFRQEQFRGMYGSYLKKVLGFFTKIFVQNEFSQKVLIEKEISNVVVSGDLRYDKVSESALHPKKISTIEHFKGESKILIGGSTWPQDEAILGAWDLRLGAWKLILAPHQIDDAHIMKIIFLFPHALRYSQISKEPVSTALDKLQTAKVLIIDNIGMLSNLYQSADIAYIGGGFGAGIHNILEAVAFGVPVIFGPNHQKFPEAAEIIQQGGGFSIANADDFQKTMQLLLSDPMVLKMASMTCKNFVQGRRGATEKILGAILAE
jgi:3-deoxy-D-manno-octulosonic-acid transferase